MATTEILIGVAKEGPQVLVLKRANRHGLVAGATGTGKTVTLQVLAEQLCAAGVSVFAADVKGDLSGIAKPGDPAPKWALARAEEINIADYAPSAPPVVLWDVYGEQGHPVRTTVTEMGPILIARILECTDAQAGAVTIAFKLADDWFNQGATEEQRARGLLLNLRDLRQILTYISDNSEEIGKTYGLVSSTTVAAIQRKLLQLEMDGAEAFFGEPALKLSDMMRTTTGPDGIERGVMNLLAANRLVQNPTLYSTFMLWLLSELWEELPEVGDLDKPKMVFFFDEAHLLFNGASKELLDRVQQVARLIRSKGVGIYFVTQSPTDVPDGVLSQLGNRVQHALRAYTPADQKAVKAAAASFRAAPGMDVAAAIQELGIGEALVSTLDEKGAPTMVARTLIAPPRSRVGPLAPVEREDIITASGLGAVYAAPLDRRSAYEVLAEQAAASAAKAEREKAANEAAQAAAAKAKTDAAAAKARARERKADERQRAPRERTVRAKRTTSAERVTGRVLSNAGNTLVREILRGIFGTVKRR